MPDGSRFSWFRKQIAELNTPDPYEKERGAIQSAFEAGEFGKAAKLQGSLVKAVEEGEKRKARKAGHATANELLALPGTACSLTPSKERKRHLSVPWPSTPTTSPTPPTRRTVIAHALFRSPRSLCA